MFLFTIRRLMPKEGDQMKSLKTILRSALIILAIIALSTFNTVLATDKGSDQMDEMMDKMMRGNMMNGKMKPGKMMDDSMMHRKPMGGAMMVSSKHSFNDTVDILKSAIEDQNLMVMFVLDGQKMLRLAGKKVKGMKQVFYFHPTYMRRVMEANKKAVIQIPLKFVVMEKPSGKVVLRYFKASTLLNQYKGEEKIAKELDGLIENIVKAIKQ